MPDHPAVSFVVPVYNKAGYLPRVLAAIHAQQGDFEREYIFVDDGSTDGSGEVVRAATAGWTGVTIVDQDNRGSAHATNQGIARARHPFVKFVDADDVLAPDATAVLLAALAPSDACLAFGEAVRYAGEAPAVAAPTVPPPAQRLDDPLPAAVTNSLFNPSQFLARTECLNAVGGCDERIVHSQEYSLTLRLARRWAFVRVAHPIAYLPQHVPDSLGADRRRQLQRVTLAVANFLQDHPDLPPGICRLACRRAAGRAAKHVRRERPGEPRLPWALRNLRSYLGVTGDPARFVAACARAFGDTT